MSFRINSGGFRINSGGFRVAPLPTIITDGLVLNLDAGNTSSYPGSGTTWTDLSGNGFNVTLVNSPTFDSANGGSIVFDGTNDYGKNEADYNTLDFAGSSFSICMWINRIGNVTAAEEILIHKESGISPTGGYQFAVDGTTGAYALRVRASSNANETFTGNSGVIPTGSWVFLCVTYNGSTITGYINGIFDSNTSTTISSIGSTNNPLGICGTFLGYVPSTNYKIASINLYNRALSASEILQNYNALKSRFGL